MPTKNPATIKQHLATTRQNLLAFLDTLQINQLQTAVYSEDTDWTILDLVRHLTDAERSMIGLMVKIRDTGEGVPEDFDLTRWNASRVKKSRALTPLDLRARMASNREALLTFMDSLDEADWEKTGRHGSGHILSLAQICQIIGDHDALHLADMEKAVKNRG